MLLLSVLWPHTDVIWVYDICRQHITEAENLRSEKDLNVRLGSSSVLEMLDQ